MSFHENLRRLRRERFLTQQMLAERAGVSWTTIARLESGRYEPRFSTIHKLAKALGVKPTDQVGLL